MDFETTNLFDDCGNDPLLNPNRCPEGAKERSQRLENIVKSDGNRLPRITEMAWISVPRALFIEGIEKMKSRQALLDDDAEGIEPVSIATNVHTRQINPQLSEQEWNEYEEKRKQVKCMHLKRSDLMYKNTFCQEWPGVLHFIQSSPKPACLIAHNGTNFDFRLLYHELRTGGFLNNQTIPEQVYFLDSLSCSYEIEKEYNREIELTTSNIDWKTILSHIQNENVELKGGSSVNVNELIVNSNADLVDSSQPQHQQQSISKLPSPSEQINNYRQNAHQNTPEKKDQTTMPNKTKTAKRALFQNELHPIQFMRKNEWSPAKRRFVGPEFFERNNRNEWSFNGNYVRGKILAGRGNFKLENMYKRLISTPQNFHRAQSDCEALLQVTLSYGRDFLKFADKHCSSFPPCFRPSKILNN